MKIISIWCGLLLAAFSLTIIAQEHPEAKTASAVSPNLKDTAILIIRHAEKPDSGSGLSPAGEKRAQAYVRYFKTFTIDSQPLRLDYLFATADSAASHRPRLTIEPLSQAL